MNGMATTARSPASAGPSGMETTEPSIDRSNDSALNVGASAVDQLSDATGLSHGSIMRTVRVMGGALIGISIMVVVLNEIFALDAIANSTGEFSGVIDSLETTGSAALGLLVIGLLVLAANQVMGFFGGNGF